MNNMEKYKNIYQKYKEIINYLIIGFCTVIISLIVYYLCVYTIFDPHDPFLLQCANVISWICAVLFAYFTNRKFVFNSKEKNKFKEFITFIGSRIITLLLDMLFMFVTVTCLSQNDKLCKIIAQVIVIILNYVLSKFFVFKSNNIVSK